MPSEPLLQRLPLNKHANERGLLVQNDYPELFEHIKHFMVSYTEPGVIRGNHYHKHKREWFLVIEGTMDLHIMNLETQKREQYTISSSQPELVIMEPNVVHAFCNIGSEKLIFLGLVNETFDESNPDTYSYKILGE